MEVQIRYKCLGCRDGFIFSVSREWIEWEEKYNIFISGQSEKSFENIRDYIHSNPIPDEFEKSVCKNCDGTTWVYEWISIEELLEKGKF